MNAFQQCLANAETEIVRKRNVPDAGWWKNPALWEDEYDPDRKLEMLVFRELAVEAYRLEYRPPQIRLVPAQPVTKRHRLPLRDVHRRQGLQLMWIPQVAGRGQPVRVLASLTPQKVVIQ